MSRLRVLAQLVARTPLHPQWLLSDRMVPKVLVESDGVVLDVGAADRWLQPLLAPDTQYVAFDYPVTACGLYGSTPDVFGDAHCLPFANESIDAVACFEVLEHVRDPEAVLSEITRVLKPGGAVALSMPFLYPVHDAPHDYQRWTEHAWRRSARANDLVVEEFTRKGHALHVAGMLACLAIAGPLQNMRLLSLAWRLPLAALLIPTANLLAWSIALLWPAWDAMGTGHSVLLRKR